MRLPNADKAIITPQKVRDYLLSPSHPIGRYKAAFFRSFSYGPEQWEVLSKDIRLLLANQADVLESTDYGTKYRIRGSISSPNGDVLEILTVWIILTDENTPRLVTAYPED